MARRLGRLRTMDDPLTLAIAPPLNETQEDREKRELAETRAKMISDEIDDRLQSERAANKSKTKPVKVLVLGQSESGKTATVKNFQMTYARKEWAAERASWRAVIQFNLVRNVNHIMDIIGNEMLKGRPNVGLSDSDSDSSLGPSLSGCSSVTGYVAAPFTDKHSLLKLRLGPLRRIQQDLERRLGASASEILFSAETSVASPFASPHKDSSGKKPLGEFCINSTNGWKTALDRFRPDNGSHTVAPGSPKRGWSAEVDEITEVILGCKEDIKSIWEDPVLRSMLRKTMSQIEESPGFFLNDVERIATRNYEPTDDDIVRARLRTVGVQEYVFTFDQGRRIGTEWHMYDVGGCRSSRPAWQPYFDDVTAVIFLAPISCFDETLAEDKRVNRLEDSFSLWESICSSKLLAKTQLILFLNKCDLLDAKLKRGKLIKDSVPSYGNKENDFPTAMNYFQQHFKAILRSASPEPRTFYVHMTSVIDTQATAATLTIVEDVILRYHLTQAHLV